MPKSPPWKNYQEEAAEFFRSLGLRATTDASAQGVRTKHDIDVLVVSQHVGFHITWVVECKRWKFRVNKLHVLALREIVHDLGADRGILLSEIGFQSGAEEAARMTNIQLTSLDELRGTTADVVGALRLQELFELLNTCSVRYWDLPKNHRIETGLRPEIGGWGYSGNTILSLCKEILTRASLGTYPFKVDRALEMIVFDSSDRTFNSSTEVAGWVGAALGELEQKLTEAESQLPDA